MKELRWQQRFENFERAFILLRSALEQKSLGEFSDLEKEGIVQRFEYTYELAWKTLKDYLEYTGVVLEQITPRQVIKEAFAANVIHDGKVWIEMLEHRNLMSHTYNQKTFEKAIEAIARKYLAVLDQVYIFLKEKSLEK
ncbi:MAG: nucleotidyltransferase [Gammaproteobacteria bacterium]|nr:MAG: nucleotidyltransferase [Gammaproteobacteria bacterium]